MHACTCKINTWPFGSRRNYIILPLQINTLHIVGELKNLKRLAYNREYMHMPPSIQYPSY